MINCCVLQGTKNEKIAAKLTDTGNQKKGLRACPLTLMASIESSFSNGCNIKSGILQGNNALLRYVYGSGSGFQFSCRSGRETWISYPKRETTKKYQYNGLQNLLPRLCQQHEGTVAFQLSTYWSIDYILRNKLAFSFKKRSDSTRESNKNL
jgi:hypothetical protein